MAKRAVVRKVVKWGGLVASALLAVVWVGNCWYQVLWYPPGGGAIGVERGRFVLAEPLWPLGLGGGGRYKFLRFPKKMHWWFEWEQDIGGRYLAVPLWAPLLIVGGATATAWRADARERRRQRVGSCPACGYDRRGLEVGRVCPECGAA